MSTWFLVLVVGIVTESSICNGLRTSKNFCQSISSKTCSFSSSTGYGSTRFPNNDHRTQSEADTEIEPFTPLLRSQCHADMQLFLCAHYVPLCIEDLKIVLKPCRSLCEEVKSGCGDLMSKFSFDWPFNCSILPELGTPCVNGQTPPTTASTTAVTTTAVVPIDPSTSSNNTAPAASTTKKPRGGKGKRRGKDLFEQRKNHNSLIVKRW